MSSMPAVLRTGLFGASSDASDGSLRTALGILHAFAAEACRVSGKYAHAHGRRRVTGDDMQRALKYCARTYFSKPQDELEADLDDARRWQDEEDGEEEGEEEGEEGLKEEAEEEDEEESEEESEDEVFRGTASPETVRTAARVDAVAEAWARWRPDDPVHQLIKRAIDRTDAGETPTGGRT